MQVAELRTSHFYSEILAFHFHYHTILHPYQLTALQPFLNLFRKEHAVVVGDYLFVLSLKHKHLVPYFPTIHTPIA